MTDGVTVTVKRNGPIVVAGPVEIRDQDGNPIVPPPAKQPGVIKFCACGRSATKPFCDGRHKAPADQPSP
jgi:CDGSH-type Zn-finger protein